MKIVFNLLNVGLGNNGGSRTIVKCAQTIQSLGVDVCLCSSVNKYTWTDISDLRLTKEIPNADVIIATGYGSVDSTVRSSIAKKFYYIRGFEKWIADKEKLRSSYKQLNCIVNSEWLKAKLLKYGVESHLVYPGIDFNVFRNTDSIRPYPIGGLYHKRHKTKNFEHVVKIAESLGYKERLLNRDLRPNPTETEINEFYNGIKVWISSSELEGLHNCPIEAGLCGCALVAVNVASGGTADYIEHNETGFRYGKDNLMEATEYTKQLLDNDSLCETFHNNLIEKLRTKIGTRQQNMQKFLNILGSNNFGSNTK